MKITSFAMPDGLHLGAVVGDEIADITASRPDLPRRLEEVLAAGALSKAADAIHKAPRYAIDIINWRAPITRPPKFLAVGLNYAAHVEETGAQPPAYQVWFNKQSTCVIGHHQSIVIPSVSEMVDYEGELGFVIGTRCRNVPASRAKDVIAGYLVVNDVSTRDWQMRTPTWTLGKSFDTHGPIGPCMVSADEIGDVSGLRLQTWVNGDLRQDAKTDDLIFTCAEMVEYLSTACTLEPGDVISTGTPSGVGMSFDPPRWLKAGDQVTISIEGIGVLQNAVISELEVEI